MDFQPLWEYQQIDIVINKEQNAFLTSPLRQNLVKWKNFHGKQQTAMKRIEAEVANMADRLEALKDAIRMTDEQLHALQARLEKEQPTDLESLQVFMNDAKRFQSNLSAYEQEIRKIKKDAADRETQQHEVNLNAARAKSEFMKLKTVYDEQKEAYEKRQTELMAQLEEMGKKIEPEQLVRYNVIKRQAFPPLARVYGDQCGGCNMSLPSATIRMIKAGKDYVECETCKRLLITI